MVLSEGKRVGITAQSWAAIDNLLRKTIEFIDTQKISTVKSLPDSSVKSQQR